MAAVCGKVVPEASVSKRHGPFPSSKKLPNDYSHPNVGVHVILAVFLLIGVSVGGVFAAPNPRPERSIISAPSELVGRAGDRSAVLHWNASSGAEVAGYHVYRSCARTGPFARQTTQPLVSLGFADLSVTNSQPYFYCVTAINGSGMATTSSVPVEIVPKAFANDDAFLDYLEQTGFDYFWYEANPANGLIRDRSSASSPCSIAAVGFGLTALGIGIDRGWITRAQGRARTLATLRTFWQGSQGPERAGRIGYKGWFYHFLDMDSATRFVWFNTELSSVDTVWLLAGMRYAREFFNGSDPDEAAIRSLSDAIFDRVDWRWMMRQNNSVSMGWLPESGFLGASWVGYNEGMMVYLLGLGAATNALPSSAWSAWTAGYKWATNYGQSYVSFAPLFGHQYTHCWVDFRQIADPYMRARGTTYFENSRRATLAQRAYCQANPSRHLGYGANAWGLTACDGPPAVGYLARGAPPAMNDDGTLAPTAPGASLPFTPEYSLSALRYLYDRYRTNIWTAYGFRDAFNLGANWWDPDILGIDQGPIVLMIENYRSERVWKLFRQSPQVQKGLHAAGFQSPASLAKTTRPLAGSTTEVEQGRP